MLFGSPTSKVENLLGPYFFFSFTMRLPFGKIVINVQEISDRYKTSHEDTKDLLVVLSSAQEFFFNIS